MSLGPAEILVILVIALLVFGPQRLPEIGRQVGRSVREFRKFQQTLRSDLDGAFDEDLSEHAEPAPRLPPRDPVEAASEVTTTEATPVPPVESPDTPSGPAASTE